MEVRLLRHGETSGYSGDLGLSDRGRAQAREAAAALAAERPADGAILVNLSGRGDKDLQTAATALGMEL
jgi:broad specificity phosphatase PhoE